MHFVRIYAISKTVLSLHVSVINHTYTSMDHTVYERGVLKLKSFHTIFLICLNPSNLQCK